ncbi:MAG: ATP synthase F1 subunit gamma [Patescibacteria group bacterium]|jgi:F-type H+-transporting ATPase subunit gamma
MAVSTRRIKARIKSIGNTRKITKAMELVAGAKMRRAVQMTIDSRHYSGSVKHIVDDIRPLINQRSHPLLYGRKEATRTILIIAASDRGMCGGFNAQLVKKSAEFIKSRKEPVSVIIVGKKIESPVRHMTNNILASFPSISNAPSFERSKSVGQLAYDEFLKNKTDRVFVCYSDFKSAMTQIPTIVQLLPVVPEEELLASGAFEKEEKDEALAKFSESQSLAEDRAHSKKYPQDYAVVFEPTPRYVLDHLLPRLIDTRLYQAMLESAASEHSSAMMAMRSATDSATEMLDNLTFTFNQARQAGITREISEISAGKAALEN